MQRAAARTIDDVLPPRKPAAVAETLEGAPHPMHQELLARWSRIDVPERKLAIPARFAIALSAACFSWVVVAAVAWAIAALM